MSVGSNAPAWERNRWIMRGILAEAVAAADNGVWIRAYSMAKIHITTSGDFVGTARVLGSTATNAPANSDNNQAQMGPDITGTTSFLLDAPCEFLKLQVVARTSGAISATCVGTEQPS